MFDITDISYYATASSGTVDTGYSPPFVIKDLISEFYDSSIPRFNPVFKSGTPNLYDLPTSGLIPTNVAYTAAQSKFKFISPVQLISLSITLQTASTTVGITLFSSSGASLEIDGGIVGSSYLTSSVVSSYDCYGNAQNQYVKTYVFPTLEVDYILFGLGGFSYSQEFPRVINKIEANAAPSLPVFWTNFKDQTETI